MNIPSNLAGFNPAPFHPVPNVEELDIIRVSDEVKREIESIYRNLPALTIRLASVNRALVAPVFFSPETRRSRQYLLLQHEKQIINSYIELLRGAY